MDSIDSAYFGGCEPLNGSIESKAGGRKYMMLF